MAVCMQLAAYEKVRQSKLGQLQALASSFQVCGTRSSMVGHSWCHLMTLDACGPCSPTCKPSSNHPLCLAEKQA